MSFSTEIFIFIFFPIVLMVYMLCKNIKVKNAVLLVASLIFYSWGGIKNCILMLFLIFVNYILGIWVKGRKKILILAVICNIGILTVFKYTGFICEILNQIFAEGFEAGITVPNIVQPIGISFFTFSILSYIIDVYYGKISAQKNVISLGLYVLMFPKIMSGPIVRYADIEDEIQNRKFNVEQCHAGLRRFFLGFAKKVILANQMAGAADAAFNYEWGLHPVYAWVGAISYTVYIYLDFSAYSDMAIGIAHIFGFHFKENFNYPYISTSIKEFWRRWHISLSSWFRDYVYIPLGGNRKGNGRTYINQMIVFFLTGLWHGASWNFIVWGLYYGCFLLIEKMTGFCAKIPKWLSYIYTMLVVIWGWVFFRADNLRSAVKYIGYMFGIQKGGIRNMDMIRVLNPQYFVFLVFSIILSTPLVKKAAGRIKQEWIKDVGVLVVFFIALCYMAASDYNPFIYFRF
ncbi:MAG: MBOAT family protein [Lachnospiraceae bacterium]|nr:MBOAT family protein [Lachnospiraceae bacterium]